MKTLLLAAFLCGCCSLPAQILPGMAPLSGSDEFLMGNRLRALRLSSPSPQQEQFLGIPDLGNAAWRVSADAVYTATNQFTFVYNAATDSIYTTLVCGSNTYDQRYGRMSVNLPLAGKTRIPAQMNVWQMSIRNQQNGSTTTVSNIAVNGVAVPGSYSCTGNNATNNWYAFNAAFGSSFTFSCTITLTGSYGGGAENNRVEFLWGSSFAILPDYFKRPSLVLRQQQKYLKWQTDAGLPLLRFELERSANGRQFSAFSTVTPHSSGRYDIAIAHHAPYQYYRVVALLPGGTRKYSPILQAAEHKTQAPVTTWRMGGQLWVQPLTSSPVELRVSDAGGRLLYAGRIAGAQVLPITPVQGLAWISVRTEAGVFTQALMP